MSANATLYYAYDPMCSWCWAFAPTWKRLKAAVNEEFGDDVRVNTLLGGLASDSTEPMPGEMQQYLQQTWRKIQDQVPGTEFNFDFWTQCQPQRSTWPACRAVIAARQQGETLAETMSEAIQRGYYLEARNPSRRETLEAMAEESGLDLEQFQQALDDEQTRDTHAREMRLTRSLGIQGFPSIALLKDQTAYGVIVDYNGIGKTMEHLERLLG